MAEKRTVKRILIIIVYLVIFALIGFAIHALVTPAATCKDGRQNQGERGVDCGGPCTPCKDYSNAQNIIIKKQAVAFGGNGTFDAVAQISNPNDLYGASAFDYEFTLKDSTGKIIAKKEGSDYILPGDSKYVVELGLATEGGATPASVGISISNPKWTVIGDIGKPQIEVYNKKISPLLTGVGNEADGTIRNDSPYDLKTIGIIVILNDDSGNIIGINRTEADSVRAGEERDFRLTWPYQLGSAVSSMDVDTQVDVFDPQNFSTSVGTR